MATPQLRSGRWTTRKWIGLCVGTAVLAGAGVVAFWWPIFPGAEDESQTQAPLAPDFEQRVRVAGGQLVLPPVAGGPATIHFEVTNLGNANDVFIREVAIEHTGTAEFYETAGPDMRRLDQISISPGKTVSFGAQERQVVLANYDSTVVPGASVGMKLTLSDGQTLSVPLTVRSAVGQGGTTAPSGVSGSVSEPAG